MKISVKAKKNPRAGKLKCAHVEFHDGGGATVKKQYHGTETDPYPPEQSAAFGSPEEAMHHLAQSAGVDSEMEEQGETPAQEATEHAAPKKGKAA